jgi:type I restriction enzyme S subunit
MKLDLDRSAWRRLALRDVVRHVTDRVDAETSGLEKFLAGEHIPSGSLSITDWGVIGRDPIGPMFYKRFGPGHVLYVSRRTYLRKVAVPEFEGITGEKTFVLETLDPGVLLQEFLPFVLSAEHFHHYAIANSRGSVNPYLNWGELARYEFELPPLDEQRRLANLLWSVERHRRRVLASVASAQRLLAAVRAEVFDAGSNRVRADRAFSITIGRQRSPRHVEGDNIVPYLRSANVTNVGIDVTDVKNMNFTPDEQAKFALKAGDVLVSEASASPGAVGIPAVWHGELPGVVCFQNTLLRFRAVDGVTLPGFVEQWCRWAFETGKFLVAASGTNIRHIGVGGAASMSVCLPGEEEQSAFLERTAVAAHVLKTAEAEHANLAVLGSALSIEIFGGK